MRRWELYWGVIVRYAGIVYLSDVGSFHHKAIAGCVVHDIHIAAVLGYLFRARLAYVAGKRRRLTVEEATGAHLQQQFSEFRYFPSAEILTLSLHVDISYPSVYIRVVVVYVVRGIYRREIVCLRYLGVVYRVI